MDPNFKIIGELSEQINSTAKKILPDIKGDFMEYKEFMDQVMTNVRVPNDVTTLFVLLSISGIVFLYNMSKIVSALTTHALAKILVLYMGFYLFMYRGSSGH